MPQGAPSMGGMQQNTASAVGRPMQQPPMMKKGGMHKMPDGKMMKNSAMKKGGMANPNC
jgi:hypothetical protein